MRASTLARTAALITSALLTGATYAQVGVIAGGQTSALAGGTLKAALDSVTPPPGVYSTPAVSGSTGTSAGVSAGGFAGTAGGRLNGAPSGNASVNARGADGTLHAATNADADARDGLTIAPELKAAREEARRRDFARFKSQATAQLKARAQADAAVRHDDDSVRASARAAEEAQARANESVASGH